MSSEAAKLSLAAAESQKSQASREAYPDAFRYWLDLDESKTGLIKNIYNHVVHWKAIFFCAAKKQVMP